MRKYGTVSEVAHAFVTGNGPTEARGSRFHWNTQDKVRVASSWNDCAIAFDMPEDKIIVFVFSGDNVWQRFSYHQRAIFFACSNCNATCVHTSARLLGLILCGRSSRLPENILPLVEYINCSSGNWTMKVCGRSWVGGNYYEKRSLYYWASEISRSTSDPSDAIYELIPKELRRQIRYLDDNELNEFIEYVEECIYRGFVCQHPVFHIGSRLLGSICKNTIGVKDIKKEIRNAYDSDKYWVFNPYNFCGVFPGVKRQGELFFLPVADNEIPDCGTITLPRSCRELNESALGNRSLMYPELLEYPNNFISTHGYSASRAFRSNHSFTDVMIDYIRHNYYVRGFARHPEHSQVKLDGWHKVFRNNALVSYSVPSGQGFGGTD